VLTVCVSKLEIKNITIKILPSIELKQALLILSLQTREFLESYKVAPPKAVADGFYIITQPLAKGIYPIHFKSSLLCTGTGCVETNFAQGITYTIIAQ
jgi:hypothetical protein